MKYINKLFDSKLLKSARVLLHGFGFDLSRYSIRKDFEGQLIFILNNLKHSDLWDVGANQGQFAQMLIRRGYSKRIVSFEPLSAAHEALLQSSTRHSNWFVYPRCAIGSTIGEYKEINISSNLQSSSFLPMLSTHEALSPQSTYYSSELVHIYSIDHLFADVSQNKSIFLKIDVQGFEMEVLKGAINSFSRISGIMLEISLVPLYEGESSWVEVDKFLTSKGFILWTLDRGFFDSNVCRTMQIDAIYVNESFVYSMKNPN